MTASTARWETNTSRMFPVALIAKRLCGPDRPTAVGAYPVGMLLTSAGDVEATIPNTVRRGVLIRLGRTSYP